MKIIVCKAGRPTERYTDKDPAAELYIVFIRKIARGVAIQDAAEQTIGPITEKLTITLGDVRSDYHYMLRAEAGAVTEEQLIHGPDTVFYRKAEHTTIARAAARDLPTSYSPIPETAFYTEESREFRDLLFD